MRWWEQSEHEHSLVRFIAGVAGAALWYSDPGAHDIIGEIGMGMTILSGLGFLVQAMMLSFDFREWLLDRIKERRKAVG